MADQRPAMIEDLRSIFINNGSKLGFQIPQVVG
jgi:hypothetical protein